MARKEGRQQVRGVAGASGGHRIGPQHNHSLRSCGIIGSGAVLLQKRGCGGALCVAGFSEPSLLRNAPLFCLLRRRRVGRRCREGRAPPHGRQRPANGHPTTSGGGHKRRVPIVHFRQMVKKRRCGLPAHRCG